MTAEAMPEGDAAIRVTATPADTNVYGDVFGGWLMAQMDLAASSVASRHAAGRAVTIAVDGMTFHRPVFVADEVFRVRAPGGGRNKVVEGDRRNLATRPT